MASLYVKDAETNDMARQLADRRGISKTAAVKIALRHELDRTVPPVGAGKSPRDILAQIRRDHPLGEPTGLEADKAFYDSLNDEDDD